MIDESTGAVEDCRAIRLTNAIDQFVYRRLAQVTASSANAKERLELAERAREDLQQVLEEILR